MAWKVLVTPRTFGKVDPEPVRLLEEAGCDLVRNPLDRPLTEEELLNLVTDVDGIIVGLDPVTANVIEQASKLKVISKYGVGINNIDLETAAKRGITVTYTPGANSAAVAELALGLMLNVARQIATSDRKLRSGEWGRYSGVELGGKTVGIVGTGRIGRELAARVKGFMRIICFDLYPDQAWARETGAEYLSLPEVLAQADFISLHLPLTPETHHLIGQKELALMKPDAIIINTARGGVIDEEALYQALVNKTIAGAGLDVFETEPLPEDSPLRRLDNVVLTSHIGAHTREAQNKMGCIAAQNLIRVLQGEEPLFVAGPTV